MAMQRAHSPSVSPARKRQRLSSPTYEDHFGELTQEDLAAFDEIEARISHEELFSSTRNADSLQHQDADSPEPQSPLAQGEPTSSFTIPRTINATLPDDSDNPFTAGFSSSSRKTVTEPQMLGFTSAAVLPSARNINRPSSPSPPPVDCSYDDWFKPAADVSADFGMTFTTASSIKGFGKVPFIMPSEASLAKAKARMAAWEMEDSVLEGKQDISAYPNSPSKHIQNTSFKKASHPKDKRPVLTTLSNALNTTDTPLSVSTLPAPSKMKMPPRQSAFKSPLQPTNMPTASDLPASNLNPCFIIPSTSGSRHPLSDTPVTAARLVQTTTDVENTPSSFSTPLRSNPRTRPAKFLTPFKPNMRPGEPGRLGLPQSGNPSSSMPPKDTSGAVTHNSTVGRTPSRKQVFSLILPPGRKTLAASGLRPQQYNVEEYHSSGIDIKMLNQITPETALFYVFHSQNDLLNRSHDLDPTEALNELHRRGCNMVTKPWIDNHWCLVLWKLAGMVALDPQSEAIPEQKRWCWSEVLRQLLYRYEREHNSGIRPPFQKIANQDVPASHPMVVCISNIFWSPGVTEDGVPIESRPELEITDGWYRLKAQIDLPLARAVRKDFLRVGRKIAIAGARLSTEKKEPSEILDAYNSTKLILSANSSYPVAWHTKLGFTRGPCISTLHKLDPNGGLIAALDLVIVKAHPLAFLEFVKTTNGGTERLGPRNEAEEQRVHEQWKKRRDLEASKLQEEYDKKFRRYEGYIERLEAKAGQLLHVAEGGTHDATESFFDKLEYPNSAAEVLSRVTPSQAALLARRTRQHVELERQTAAEEIERELQESCPPREVRAFRVLIVQDSRTHRKPANRTAQLTVWNVMSLTLDEGSGPGDFAVGQRYLVSNVVPTSLSAWMDREPGSEVYLSTRRDTGWIKIKTS